MLNYWWVTRPKRKLTTVPEVLATVVEMTLNREWSGQRDTHLCLEDALEDAGLKRTGERRDQGGGGARTYVAWLKSLGLLFTQESTKQIKLTLAGEAIFNGESPVPILTRQIIKYQFPSTFSISRGVGVHERFKIHPFWFLIKLLCDDRLCYLTQDEIEKIIIVEAENDGKRCYEQIVSRILQFRNEGSDCIRDDYFDEYTSTRAVARKTAETGNLKDVANTIINWLEYTQLISRDRGCVRILPDKFQEACEIAKEPPCFIDHPEDEENFQRKFGVDPRHNKDTRNLTNTKTITSQIIDESKIRTAFLNLSILQPIAKINSALINQISEKTGISVGLVEDTLYKNYPNGAIGGFLTNFFEMAFKGREDATEFEKATVSIFKDVFGFETHHVGPKGLTPDVHIISDAEGYQGIIDNKAYRKYAITNDHYNRMVDNYINGLNNYSNSLYPLAFFSYIAGDFSENINSQLMKIVTKTGVNGSALSITNFIRMIENQMKTPYQHSDIRRLLGLNREVLLRDIERYK